MENAAGNPKVTNCTFSGNSAPQGGGMSSWYASHPTLSNCIFWGNTAENGPQIYSLATVVYSDVEGGWAGTGNINADPLFVDPAADDFHLQSTSPCIDTGTNVGAPPFDLEGRIRPWDGDGDLIAVVDMGAYEFGAPLRVYIDIKPGSDPNSINLSENGLLPVAILASPKVDVETIDPETITIGKVLLAARGSKKAPKLAYSLEDVNGDGKADIMMTFFDVQMLVNEGVLGATTDALILTATLDDGTLIEGIDSVRILPY